MSKSSKAFSYPYARPSMTVDVMTLGVIDGQCRLLLIKRGAEPFEGKWALPGGFVDENEALDQAARREMLEETGVKLTTLEAIAGFGDPGRDPRGWTVSSAFYTLINPAKVKPAAGDDASDVAWKPADRLPPMAFDHRLIVRVGLERFRRDLYTKALLRPHLPKTFSVEQLHAAYVPLDPRTPTAERLVGRLLDFGVLKEAGAGAFQFVS